MRRNGDIFLTQERFTRELLKTHGMDTCRPNKSVTMDKPSDAEDIPTPEELTQLQSHSGAFNWLATRTRPDVSYWTSLLASASSRQCKWSQELAHKVLRYLAGAPEQGMLMTATGSEDNFEVFSDAGFAGADTRSQNGLVILWGGSIITWRSSRAALSALSTAEAELCAAALAWQIAEGIRYFLGTLHIHPKLIHMNIDNKAALTAASLGATWRTQYYAVRAKRLLEESQLGRVAITHCPTKEMVADTLTKLATAEVIPVLTDAMSGILPARVMAHRTSVSPGPANRGDIAGDGPPPTPAYLPQHIVHPGLPTEHPMWTTILEVMHRKWSSLHNVPRIPEILKRYEGQWPTLYAAFIQHHRLTNHQVQRVFDEVLEAEGCRSTSTNVGPVPPASGPQQHQTPQPLQPRQVPSAWSGGKPFDRAPRDPTVRNEDFHLKDLSVLEAKQKPARDFDEDLLGLMALDVKDEVDLEMKAEKGMEVEDAEGCGERSGGKPFDSHHGCPSGMKSASGSAAAKVETVKQEEIDDVNDDHEQQPPKKKRRGAKRCRPGSSERQWAALEQFQ